MNTKGSQMSDDASLVVVCSSVETAIGDVNSIMPNVLPSERKKLNAYKLEMIRSGGKQALYDRFHGRRVDELVAEWDGFNPDDIASEGEIDSFRYILLKPNKPDEASSNQ